MPQDPCSRPVAVLLLLLAGSLAAAPPQPSWLRDAQTRVDAVLQRVASRGDGAADTTGEPVRRTPPGVRLPRRPRLAGALLPGESLQVLSTAHVPTAIFMVLTQDTRDEVRGMAEVLAAYQAQHMGGTTAPPLRLHLVTDDASVADELALEHELADVVELDESFPTDDIWMQDWGEFVALQRPGERIAELGALDLGRGRGLVGFADHVAGLLGARCLRIEAPLDYGDYGGNIEATPDGLLLLGNTTSKQLEEYFLKAGYDQDHVLTLDTSWLEVGHVDEVLSLLPVPEEPHGYVVAHADPVLGMELLRNLSDEQWQANLDEIFESGMRAYPTVPQVLEETREPLRNITLLLAALRAYLRGEVQATPPPGESWPWEMPNASPPELHALQADAGRSMERMLVELDRVVRLNEGPERLRRLRLPTLMVPGPSGGSRSLLPEATNMVVLPGALVIPDPLLPVFRDAITEAVRSVGYEPFFLPALTYHLGEGQLHCATHVLRDPNRVLHPRYAAGAERQPSASSTRSIPSR